MQDRAVVTGAERAVDRMSAALDQLIDVARLEMGAVAVETALSLRNDDVAMGVAHDRCRDVRAEHPGER